jgi:sRNA-binding carbon storage regulator CsrA
MLCLTRVINQRIRILAPGGEVIWITLIETDRNKAMLGIDAPAAYQIQREENLYRDRAKQPPPASGQSREGGG